MAALSSYILSLIAAGMLVGILSSLVDVKTAPGGLIKMLGGIALLIIMIEPVVAFRFDTLADYALQSFLEGEMAAQWGKDQARDAMAEIISEETRAYILDKAGLYGADIRVEVTLNDEEIPVPEQVTIQGACSPDVRSQLEQFIASQLGIPKEHQIWIGNS